MSAWDEIATEWDDAETVRAYAAEAFDSLLEVVETAGFDLDGSWAMDFGCGTGLLTERLAERCAAIDAVDTSAVMLDGLQAKIEAHGWTHVQPFRDLPKQDGPYDLIVCSSVLAFVEDLPATVADLVGRLRDGGLFVQWDWELDPGEEDEHAGLSRQAIGEALRGAGLSGVQIEPAFIIKADGERLRPVRAWGVRGATAAR